ncbi:hypothetical protein TrCOL_g10864 [Triparma columacea]|uniref:Uncharacterized protein n=1 Tax=Triparma columacea TaxID=722753 RepID=A0A9W7FX68_9STRA|nr:hypothetical protein TrCOL_g10864 [Triparma columacea]
MPETLGDGYDSDTSVVEEDEGEEDEEVRTLKRIMEKEGFKLDNEGAVKIGAEVLCLYNNGWYYGKVIKQDMTPAEKKKKKNDDDFKDSEVVKFDDGYIQTWPFLQRNRLKAGVIEERKGEGEEEVFGDGGEWFFVTRTAAGKEEGGDREEEEDDDEEEEEDEDL